MELQEAALTHSNVSSVLRDAVYAAHKGTGKWAEYMDHNGDGQTGDVFYRSEGSTMSCPYEIADVNGAQSAKLDKESARPVAMRVSYVPVADDDDHYAAMSESKLYATMPLYERFISKAMRDAAKDEDFAGKNKSYPILSRDDVAAAVHAIGRAGADNYGAAKLKANIIAIAKRKGWTDALPKAWQGGATAEEAARGAGAGAGLALRESAATLEPIVLREARADYEIRLISPGKGSTAFYPAEVLKRDGPKVFKAGTHVYLNHQTKTEESDRPEGDVKNLAGVLTGDAVYREDHPKGEGLYGRMKVFADHAALVEEKAPHVGMSIRAAGVSGGTKDGLPVLKELLAAKSVDIVTKAGRGGMILSESANSNSEETMNEETAKQLIEAAIAPYRQKVVRAEARETAAALLKTISLPDAAKERIIARCTEAAVPQTSAGDLDAARFRDMVVAEAQNEGRYLSQIMGSGAVHGMGGSTPFVVASADELKEAKKARKLEAEALTNLAEAEDDVFAALTGIAGSKQEAA